MLCLFSVFLFSTYLAYAPSVLKMLVGALADKLPTEEAEAAIVVFCFGNKISENDVGM